MIHPTKYTVLLVFSFFSINMIAQIGINNTSPDPSAILDITSNSQGILTPRMTTTERNLIASPANGLLVFDTTLGFFYYYTAGSWVQLGSATAANDTTGWADYVDTQYNSITPFTLTPGNKVTLPNNAGAIRDAQKPLDITTFYDNASQTITGRNGDGINIVIEFKARPTTNNTTNRITVSIDIGFEIYKRDFVLAKGTGVEHFYLSSFNAYTLNTWEANGGSVKIVATDPAEIYDIRYVITRTHKAR